MARHRSQVIRLYYGLALLLLVSGYLFYLTVRHFDPLGILPSPVSATFAWTNAVSGSLATFIHVLAMGLLSHAVLGARRERRYPLVTVWVAVSLLVECLQLPLFAGRPVVVGTFDPFDLVAAIIGGGVFMLLTGWLDDRHLQPEDDARQRFRPLFIPVLAVLGVGSILASTYDDDSYETEYMSYEELRAPLQVEKDRPLKATGKIYLYQDYLIVSEPNKGIHIYDNTDKTTPVHKAFLKVPGNLDIAVRDGYLYADSFIDLVVININDIDNISTVHRVESIFPYDPYQALPEEKRNYNFSYDESKGVVIDVHYRPIIY